MKLLSTLTTVSLAVLLTACGDATTSPSTTFSYDGKTGPQYWAELDDKYKTCANGLEITAVQEGEQHQSPVDFYSAVPKNPNFTLDYDKLIEFKVLNNGHTIELEAEGTHIAQVTIDNKIYDLKQFHFHSLSEHTINGMHYPMEAHFVNVDKNGSIAVIGMMIEESSGVVNEELSKIFSTTFPNSEEESNSTIELNPLKLLPTGTVYSYSGSLTTPPCSENVTWNVYSSSVKLSKESIGKFTNKYDHNYRPITGTN